MVAVSTEVTRGGAEAGYVEAPLGRALEAERRARGAGRRDRGRARGAEPGERAGGPPLTSRPQDRAQAGRKPRSQNCWGRLDQRKAREP